MSCYYECNSPNVNDVGQRTGLVKRRGNREFPLTRKEWMNHTKEDHEVQPGPNDYAPNPKDRPINPKCFRVLLPTDVRDYVVLSENFVSHFR